MPAPAKQRFFNISTFMFGTDEYNTIKEISVDEQTEEITDSGDDDAADTFIEKGKTTVRFTISMSDPIQAQAIKNHAKGTITFSGSPATGGTALDVTITNALVFNRSNRAMHNGVYSVQLTGRCESYSVAAAA